MTNDSGASNVSLPIEGQVVSAITISPASLFLGVLKPGESVKKRLVVRGSEPFRFVSVKCDDASFTFEKPDADSKSLHFVPVDSRRTTRRERSQEDRNRDRPGSRFLRPVHGQRHDQTVRHVRPCKGRQRGRSEFTL